MKKKLIIIFAVLLMIAGSLMIVHGAMGLANASTICHSYHIRGGKKPFSYVWTKFIHDGCKDWPRGLRIRAAGQCISGFHVGNWIDDTNQLSKAYCAGGAWLVWGFQRQYPHQHVHFIQKG